MKNNLGTSTQNSNILPSHQIVEGAPSRSPIKRAALTNETEFYNKRIPKIQALFAQNQISLDEYLPEREILGFLDYLGDNEFDRDVAAQLFEKLPSYPDQANPSDPLYNVQEFVETHIKAEYLLLQQVNEIEGELQKTYAEIDVIKRQYDDQMAGRSASGESNLNLDVLEAVCEDERFTARKGDKYTVVLISKPYKYETDEVACGSAKFNLSFNYQFHIRLAGDQDHCVLLLRNNDARARDANYNDLTCELSLEHLAATPNNETVWFTCNDVAGNPTAFKVSARVECSISKFSFLEDHLKNLLQLEQQLNESKENVEQTLRALVHPFVFAPVTAGNLSPTKGLATSQIPNH
jgi:hypothetical protein